MSLVLLALAGFAIAGPACTPSGTGAPNRQPYELTERCARDAAAWFPRALENNEPKGGWFGAPRLTIKHFNRRLNKCLAEIEEDHENLERNSVYDVNEDRLHALYVASSRQMLLCDAWGRRCDSLEEWHRLITPYMEQ
jgi:hypothetical protein